MSNPLKKLAGQTAIYGLGTVMPRILNYLLTPILTYEFSAAEFGINSELYAYISFLNVIFTYGMETAFFNFNSKLENKQDVFNTSFWSLLLSSTVFSGLLLLFTSNIANELSTPNAVYLPQFIVWSILIIATDAIAIIPFAKLRTEGKALKFSLLKLTNIIINFGLTIFFLKICKSSYDLCEVNSYAALYNPQIGIGYVFLSILIANVITLILLGNQLIGLKFSINLQLLKKMLSYAWPLIILGLAAMINDTLDKIIIKKLEKLLNGDEKADTLVLGWGSTYGGITQAVNRLNEKGVKVASAHLTFINPFPDNLGEILSNFERIIIPELNTGQLIKLIRERFLIDAKGINKVAGEPFTAQELVEKIEEKINE